MGESEMAIARDRVLDDAGYDDANDDYAGDNVARLEPVKPRLLRNFMHGRNALRKLESAPVETLSEVTSSATE